MHPLQLLQLALFVAAWSSFGFLTFCTVKLAWKLWEKPLVKKAQGYVKFTMYVYE